MRSRDVISRRQFYAGCYIALLSPMIRLLPKAPLMLAGRVSWLSPFVAAAGGLLWLALLRSLFRNREDGEGMQEMINRCVGRTAGGVIAVVTALWLTFCCGFMLRTGAERLLSAVYDNGNTAVFILVPLAAATAVALGDVKSLARCGEIFALAVTAAFILICVLSAGGVKAEYLLPVSYKDAGKIAIGALPVMEIMSGYAYAMYLYKYVPAKQLGGSPVKWMLGQTALAAAIMIVTVGSCSAPLAERLQSPFFVTIRNVTALGFVERIESAVIAIWVAADFLLYGFALIAVSGIWQTVTKAADRKKFVIPTAAAAGACAFFVSKNAFDLAALSDKAVPAVNFFAAFAGVPILYIVGKIRRKI